MVLSIIPTFIDHIVSAPSITNPEQLRGKIGSVNRFGSISDMGMRLSLKKLGIDPEKDVKIVPAGGNPERLGGDFERHFAIYDHERAVHQRKPKASASAIWSTWRL